VVRDAGQVVEAGREAEPALIQHDCFRQYWLYSYGGGICLRNSNASFVGTFIEGNFADQGGGVYAEDGSNFSFEQGTVSENDATDGGGVNLSGASGSFSNAIVACNTASTDGGGLFTERSGTSTFTNTVFHGNRSSTSGTARGAEAYIGTSTTFNLFNSIVEASSGTYALYGAGGTGTHTYDNVYNVSGSTYGGTLAAGSGAISSGSNFTSASCDGNPYNDTYTLTSTSASIDAGDPSSAYNDADGSRNDMGAFGGQAGHDRRKYRLNQCLTATVSRARGRAPVPSTKRWLVPPAFRAAANIATTANGGYSQSRSPRCSTSPPPTPPERRARRSAQSRTMCRRASS
jgi:hypothetical protein